MTHILLIEPDRLLGATYRQALEADGFRVVVCPGAQAAIFAADERTPAMVVLELQLIEHSGIEFLYEFRSYPEWQDIPVIVLSQVPPAEFNGSRSMLMDELGVVEYHYKPLTSLGALLGSVRRLAVQAA